MTISFQIPTFRADSGFSNHRPAADAEQGLRVSPPLQMIYVFVFQVFHFLVREIAAETYFSVFFLHLLMKLEPKT